MAKERKTRVKGEKLISVRVELSHKQYDLLMDCAEREKRSVRAQAAYLVEQGLEQWQQRQGGGHEPAR